MGSRYYGSMSGSARTEATRQGRASSGMECHIRGWERGVSIDLMANDRDGRQEDIYRVRITSGSNHRETSVLAFEIRVDNVTGEYTVTNVGKTLEEALKRLIAEEEAYHAELDAGSDG